MPPDGASRAGDAGMPGAGPPPNPAPGPDGAGTGAPRADVPQVVVVGSASRDLDAGDTRGWRLGGTVSYVALGIARLGLRVGAVLGLDPAARAAHELELLRDAGVELEIVPLAEMPTFDIRETPSGRDLRCVAVGDPIPAAALPTSWGAAPVLVLAPVAGELDGAWAQAVPEAWLVGLALQGVLRMLTPGRRAALKPLRRGPLLDRADLVMVGRDDLERSGTCDPFAVALSRPGQRMVVSAGAGGGMWLARRGDGILAARRYPAVTAACVRDMTGAGDAFLAGWVVAEHAIGGREANGSTGGSLRGRRPARYDARVLRFAATVACLKVEGYGLAGVPDLHAVAARLRMLG